YGLRPSARRDRDAIRTLLVSVGATLVDALPMPEWRMNVRWQSEAGSWFGDPIPLGGGIDGGCGSFWQHLRHRLGGTHRRSKASRLCCRTSALTLATRECSRWRDEIR